MLKIITTQFKNYLPLNPESEDLEFKCDIDKLGKYFSVLSNEAKAYW